MIFFPSEYETQYWQDKEILIWNLECFELTYGLNKPWKVKELDEARLASPLPLPFSFYQLTK